MTEIKCFARTARGWNSRRVEIRFAEVDGRLVCIGVEIGPRLEGDTFHDVTEADLRPLTTAEVRLPLRRIVEGALQAAVMVRTGTGDFATDVQALADDLAVLQAAQAEPPKRTGRPRVYGPEHFQEVAHVYREHERKGGRTPTKAVQEHFKVSKSTAAKWVARARDPELGMLRPLKGETDAS